MFLFLRFCLVFSFGKILEHTGGWSWCLTDALVCRDGPLGVCGYFGGAPVPAEAAYQVWLDRGCLGGTLVWDNLVAG